MQSLIALGLLAIIAEAITEYLTSPLGKRFPSWLKAYTGMLFGVVLCVSYGADLLAALGLTPSLLGPYLTGVLIGRGSNVFSDLVSRLQVVRLPAAPVSAVQDGDDRP